jgi:hypothetical protein
MECSKVDYGTWGSGSIGLSLSLDGRLGNKKYDMQ